MPWEIVPDAKGEPTPFSPALWTVFSQLFPDVFSNTNGNSLINVLSGNETSQLMQRALTIMSMRGTYRQRFMLPMNGAASASASEVGNYTVKSRADWANAKLRAAAEMISIFGWPVQMEGGAVDIRADLVDDVPLRILLHLVRLLSGRRLNVLLWVFSDVRPGATEGSVIPRLLTRIERARSDQYLPLRLHQDDFERDFLELDPGSVDGAATIAGPGEAAIWLILGRDTAPNSPLYVYRPPGPTRFPIMTTEQVQSPEEVSAFAPAPHPITNFVVIDQGNPTVTELQNAAPLPLPEGADPTGMQALLRAADLAWKQTGRGFSIEERYDAAGRARPGMFGDDLYTQLGQMLQNGGQSGAVTELSRAAAHRYAQGILLVASRLAVDMQSPAWRAAHAIDLSGFTLPAVDPNLSIEQQAVQYGTYFWEAIVSSIYPADDTFAFLCSMASSWGEFSHPLRYQIVHQNWFTNLVPELDAWLNAPGMPGAYSPAALVVIRRLEDQSWSVPVIFHRFNMYDASQWLLEHFKRVQPVQAIKRVENQRRRGGEVAPVALKRREYQRRTGALRIVPPGQAAEGGGTGVTGPPTEPLESTLVSDAAAARSGSPFRARRRSAGSSSSSAAAGSASPFARRQRAQSRGSSTATAATAGSGGVGAIVPAVGILSSPSRRRSVGGGS